MTTTIIWTIAILTVLGAALAVVLYIVAEKFKVEEDPRIDEVEKVLPGANCGGCGQAGCRAFAQFCVESSPDLDKCFCPVGGNDGMQKVAAVLGVEVAVKEPQVAVVRCNGSCENRPRTNEYGGYQSCRVKAALYSGDTGCSFGCLGCGDCVAACQFGAISMDPATGLPVVDEEKCTACGACVKACPKNIIEIRNKGRRNMRVFVSCVNKDKGAVARKACKAACIGCGKCAKRLRASQCLAGQFQPRRPRPANQSTASGFRSCETFSTSPRGACSHSLAFDRPPSRRTPPTSQPPQQARVSRRTSGCAPIPQKARPAPPNAYARCSVRTIPPEPPPRIRRTCWPQRQQRSPMFSS